MKALIRFLLLSLPIVAAAQSQLPPCPATGYKHHCFGTAVFVDGNQYVGEFKDGKLSGQGTYTFANGNKYVGEFKDNKRNGQGTFTFADGATYVGEFNDDKFAGQGTYTWVNGNKYVGEFKDSKRNGQGTLAFANGNKYVGEFKDDKFDGQGIEYRADSSINRSGQWAAGALARSFALDPSRFPFNAPTQPIVAAAQSQLPPCPATGYKHNCFGTEIFTNGSRYVGEFRDGKFNGQGTYIWADGNKYVGEFKDNNFNGQGTYTWANGNKYVGEYQDDKRNGQGTYTWANGDKYVGDYKDDKGNGQGTYIWVNGDKYVGEFKDNDFNGQGTLTSADGEKYVGEFKDDKRNGQGIEYRADGSIKRSGRWAAGDLVQSFALERSRFPFNAPAQSASVRPNSALPPCPSSSVWGTCFGSRTFSNGDKYAGEFKDGVRNGQGTYTWANGDMYVGEFKDGKFNGQGTLTLVDGGKYVGEFKDDKRNGQGTNTFANGHKHVGEYKDGVRNGQGTFTWANGDKYVGEYKDDKSNGLGIEYRADGSIKRSGQWAAGDLVQPFALDRNRFPFNAPTQIASVRPNSAPVTRNAEPARPTLTLSATASQPDANGVVILEVTTNTDTASLKINGDEAGSRADGRYSVNRFARVGSNSYEVIATDRFGNTSRRTVVVNREIKVEAERVRSLNPTLISATQPRDAVAIIIGIEKYRRVPDADFANNDASTFYDYARRALGIKPENIRLLVDDKADAAEILRAFKTWLPPRVNKNTTDVYVFYSGHGLPSEDGGSLYFLPHEVDRDLLERTAITQKEVVQTIQRTAPKSVTMFIDSCYSGQSRTGTSLLASARPISVAPKASSDFPPNFMVISASAPDQISSSSPELKHGIFSYYLMLGMEGEADANQDGQITVGEMQTYLSQQVTRRASGMNRAQSPQATGDLNHVLVRLRSTTR